MNRTDRAELLRSLAPTVRSGARDRGRMDEDLYTRVYEWKHGCKLETKKRMGLEVQLMRYAWPNKAGVVRRWWQTVVWTQHELIVGIWLAPAHPISK